MRSRVSFYKFSGYANLVSKRWYSSKRLGLFGVDVLSKPAGFQVLTEKVQKNSDNLLKLIVNKFKNPASHTSKSTVELFDDLSNEICCAADLAECVRNMHSEKEFALEAHHSMREFTNLVETLNTDTRLYLALKNSLETEADRLDEVDIRTIRLFLADFEQSGVQLPVREREEFVKLSNEIYDAGASFAQAADEPVQLSSSEKRKYGVDEIPHPYPDTSDREAREFFYNKYFQHNREQENQLRRLVSCRDRLAKLTGFPTFSHRAQQFSILGSYENVKNFLEGVIKEFQPLVGNELELLISEMSAQDEKFQAPLLESDLHYAICLHRRRNLFNLGDLSRYFYFENLLFGLEFLLEKIYGIYIRTSAPISGEIWPGNVIKLEVFNHENTFLGVIFIDTDYRPSKTMGDCHYTVRCSKLLENGEYQTPIVVLSLNWSSPEDSFENIKVTPQQAGNFFHEMGHAIHSMLGRTRYQHVAGTRCPTDMAEIPSNLMEYFFNDYRILTQVCKDKSGRPISEDEAKALIDSRYSFGCLETLQQVIYSLFDLEIHGPLAENIAQGKLTTTEIFHDISTKALPQVKREKSAAWQHRFSHLVPYGAKYYSYLVAKASASLIWHSQFEKDPFCKINGAKWAEVQSHGGEYPSSFLLKKVLGHIPEPHQLIGALKRDFYPSK
uniref:Peptidase M3A/M3B catalytic domain-containing protein n=1 Tax=Acrobeloides nanus TaxID=290746 RepID=A0A914EAW4_9BILA